MKKKNDCKHDIGWFIKEKVDIFVFEDGRLVINNQHGKEARIVATCNNTACRQERSIYISQRPGQVRIAKNPLRRKRQK